MTASEPDRLDRIEELLTGFNASLETLRTDITKEITDLKKEVSETKEQTSKTNERVEIYQKASQQVVNLAFGLILTAALAIIIPVVTNR